MTMMLANSRADQIYTTGPETLVAQSSTIVAGPVASYSRRVLEMSQLGPDGFPLRWTVSGQVENPKALKGSPDGPVPFTRMEESVFVPDSDSHEEWERDYGELHANDEAVLFLSGNPAGLIKVLPSGTGERDLATLVKDIAAIQSHPDKQAAWLAYLERARQDQGRKAALRSLVQAGTDWHHLSSAMERFMANPTLTEAMRAYAFGIVAFGLTGNHWASSKAAVGDFLGRQYESEGRPKLMLQYILNLKLVLRYTMEEAHRANRESLRVRIADSLRRREASASRSPELAQQYQQIRAAYPGLL